MHTLQTRVVIAPENITDRKAAVLEGLARLRAELLLTHPFFAHLALQLELKALFDCRVSTAATDGTCIYFSVPFFESIPEAYRTFVMIHEIMHCVLGHHRRELGRTLKIWNIATDHEINHALVREGFTCPQEAILLEEFEDQSAEYIYEKIQLSYDFLELSPRYLHGIAAPSGTFDPDYPLQCKTADAEILGHLLRRAQNMSSTNFGSLPGCCQSSLRVLSRPSKVSWRSILQEFVTRAVKTRLDWNRPQRRLVHQKLYLPSRRSDSLSIMVAIDVSGSVYSKCGEFLSELKLILTALPDITCELVTFDTQILTQQTVDVEEISGRVPFTIKGGGGTDFQPVMDLLHAKLAESGSAPPVVIVLTDGYANEPTLPPAECCVLWALTQDGIAPAEWGSVLTLDY
jgi:predicted metal-dependent peptidase